MMSEVVFNPEEISLEYVIPSDPNLLPITVEISVDIYTLAIAVSVVIFVAVGINAGRSVKQLDDYFVAGRRAPTLLIVGTLVASV